MSYRKETMAFWAALYRLDEAFSRFAVSSKVGENAFLFLYALEDGAALSQKALTKEWGIPRSTLNTIVKRYEAEGYVVSVHVPGTRRELGLSLTERGRAYAASVLADVHRCEERAMEAMTRAYGTCVTAALDCYAAAFREGKR